jgi:hypothetical protein
MRAFPPASELQFLVGLEIEQICLDPWSTQFRLNGGVNISVQGSFEHVDLQGRSHEHQCGEEQDRGPVFLRELIQQRISLLHLEPHCLTLSFGNGSRLRIRSEVGPYEDGQIYPPGCDIPIVF